MPRNFLAPAACPGVEVLDGPTKVEQRLADLGVARQSALVECLDRHLEHAVAALGGELHLVVAHHAHVGRLRLPLGRARGRREQRVEVGVDLGVEPGQRGLRHGGCHLRGGGIGDGRRGSRRREDEGVGGRRRERLHLRGGSGLGGLGGGLVGHLERGPSLCAGHVGDATEVLARTAAYGMRGRRPGPRESLRSGVDRPAGVRPLYVPRAWDGAGIGTVPPTFRGWFRGDSRDRSNRPRLGHWRGADRAAINPCGTEMPVQLRHPGRSAQAVHAANPPRMFCG